MRGKRARGIRRITGFRPNMPRQYRHVEAAVQQVLVPDKEATEAMGELRLRLDTIPKMVYFHNDASRAVYRHTKKEYTKNRIK